MVKRNRIYSIDVVRGTAVFLGMIMSNPGTYNLPTAFVHAWWHGIHLIDYSLPLFVMAMCMVIPLIFEKDRVRAPEKFLVRIIRRSVLLFLLGLLLNFTPEFNFSTLRVLGVLQRLALVYFAVNIYILVLRHYAHQKQMMMLLLGSALLLSILYMIAVHPWGYEVETNIIRRIDLKILTEDHMYEMQSFDPEGIFSTLGAIASGLFGSVMGYLLIDKTKTQRTKLITMLILGTTLLLISFITGIWVPINKKMWTGTFIFNTAGCITLYTALCFYLCDMKLIRKPFRFLTSMSSNALFIYVTRQYIIKLIWPIEVYYPPMDQLVTLPAYITYRFFKPLVGTTFEGVGFGFIYALIWVQIAKFMHKKNLFIRL